jgi:hypothetical protein
MRTWGRNKAGQWVKLTDTNLVWLATLVQTLRLGEGESPFYGNYGLPAQQSIAAQITPDAAVARTQAQYAPYFASLSVAAVASARQPTYTVQAVLPNGEAVTTSVAT